MEADKSSGTEPIFTLNDFPAELIERFAPDLRPRTVSTLRLVSPRFRDVFTSDHYNRSYLFYKNRQEFYREDLEKFGEARDRWRRCLEAEKKRLDNWRHGRPTRVETVQIPNCERRGHRMEWHGAVGERGNYWMISELENRKILMANVTARPITSVVDVSCHTSFKLNFAHILADQVVIKSADGSRKVFNILNDGSKLSLKHIFTVGSDVAAGVYISGMSLATKAYRNLYISHIQSRGILRVWDLKQALALDSLDLNELLPLNRATTQGQSYCLIGLKKTEFPYVLATIENSKTREVLYLAVNVEEKRIDCCVVHEDDLSLSLWEVNGHECFMEFGNISTEIRIYDLRPGLRSGPESRLLLRQTLDYQTENIHYEPPWVIGSELLCNTKIFVTDLESGFLSVVGGYLSEIHDETPIEFQGAAGPFLIVGISPSICDDEEKYRLVTWENDGLPLFDWSEMLNANGFEVEYVGVRHLKHNFSPQFCSLSKCVVQKGDGDTLYICHF